MTKHRFFSTLSLRNQRFFLVIASLIFLSPASEFALAETRLWTSADGKTRVTGELIGTDKINVYLKKRTDRKVYSVPLKFLSDDDQAFVRQKYPKFFEEQKTAPAITAQQTQPETLGQTVGEGNGQQTAWQNALQQLPNFEPFMLDGVPAVDDVLGMMSRDQRAESDRTNKKIGSLLKYLCTPGVFENLAIELKQNGAKAPFETGTRQERRKLSRDFILFQDIHGLFFSIEEQEKLKDVWNQKINEFDKGIQLAAFVTRVHEMLKDIQFPHDEVPISVVIRAEIPSYSTDQAGFKLKVRRKNHLHRIGGKLSGRIEPIYPVPPETPTLVKVDPEAARDFARALDGKQLLLKYDVVLSNFRYDAVAGPLSSGPEEMVNAKVVKMELISEDDPSNVIYRWGTDPQPATSLPAAGPEGETGLDLATKMQLLGTQHQLTMYEGYPVLLTDDRRTFRKPHLNSDNASFSKLLDRVALKLDSDYLNAEFAARHFPETIGRYIEIQRDRRGEIHTANWKGASEFERRETEASFKKAYSEKADNYGVDLPIRFVEIRAVPLSKYDFERKGFTIDHDASNCRMPKKLTISWKMGLSREFTTWERPCSVQKFVPFEPAQAQSLFGDNDSINSFGFVKSIVTWDRIDLVKRENNNLPPVTVTHDSFELFADPMLEKRLTKLKFQHVAPAVLSHAGKTVLPTEQQPIQLDPSVLSLFSHEANQTEPSEEELFRLFQVYRNVEADVQSKMTFRHYEVYQRTGSDITDWQAADEKTAKDFKSTVSTFFPYAGGHAYIPEDLRPELSRRWRDWMAQCFESTQRTFVVDAEAYIDPNVRDAQLGSLNASRSDPYAWDVSKQLIDRGVSPDQLVLLSKRTHAELIKYCLKLEKPLSETLRVPEAVKDKIVENLNGRARVELVVTINEAQTVSNREPNEEDGLVLSGRLNAVCLFSDQVKLHEYTLDHLRTSQHSESTKRQKEEPPASQPAMTTTTDQGFQPLTPAKTLLLIARYLPKFADESRMVLMHNRWSQESDFQSDGDQSYYGVDPKLGMYFRSNSSRPTRQQLTIESQAFGNWLKTQAQKIGSGYTLKLTTKFGEHNEQVNGYWRDCDAPGGFDAGSRYGSKIHAVSSELKRIKRRIDFEASQGNNFGGGGGGGGGGGIAFNTAPKAPTPSATGDVKASEKYQKQIQELTTVLAYLNTAPPIELLDGIDYRYRFKNLDDKGRVSNIIKTKTGAWNPNEIKVMNDPIHPVVRMNHHVVLPDSLRIKPEKMDFQIEIDFQIKSAKASDKPPEVFDPEIVEDLQLEDFGKYVVFDVDVKSAWLLHPNTSERLHKLKLIAIVNPKPE